MFASALITLREGLEAALIVGVVLAYLGKIGRPDRRGAVWGGVAAALATSIVLAVALQALGAQFEGRAEQIFEGTTMFLAVLVLTYMIFWMRGQGHRLRGRLEGEVGAAVSGGQGWALAGLAFFAVFREGVETALFLSAAGMAAEGARILWGGLLGLAVAVILGWLIFNTTANIPLRRFFDVTSLLLLLFAAGLLAHGVHEFQEAGLLPSWVAPVWDINPVLPESSLVGSFMKALFGYNGDPSLLEVTSYLVYWVAVLLGVRWWVRRLVPRAASSS
jgi:high-affinity iron transporter